VIPQETDDEIVMTGRVDAAAVNSDRAAVGAAAQMIGQAQAAVQAVQAVQASLDQARLNLSYTHIVAPASGVVDNKTVQVGQRVQPGEQLLTVVPLNDIWVTADFRETQLRKMRRGEPVKVHVDTTGRDYKGYVEGLPGATGELDSLLPPENATGNYVKVVQRLPVRIRLYPGEDPDHRLRPGMSVEPTVWVNSEQGTSGAATAMR
jgi:membrane fusion protein, multidrug efflux system